MQLQQLSGNGAGVMGLEEGGLSCSTEEEQPSGDVLVSFSVMSSLSSQSCFHSLLLN